MEIYKSYTREDLVVLAAKLVASRLTFGQLDKDGVYLKGGNKGDLGQPRLPTKYYESSELFPDI